MERSIELEGLDKILRLSKVTELNFGHLKDKEFIFFEKLKDGTWRLTYTASTVPDIQQLQSLKIIRKNENH